MGNRRYHTHREMADGKPFCAATGPSDGREFMAGIQSPSTAGGRGTRLHTHLLTKSSGSHVVHSSCSEEAQTLRLLKSTETPGNEMEAGVTGQTGSSPR